MLEIRALPAREGDALWMRWGEPDQIHQLFIDMGTEASGRLIRGRLQALPEPQRSVDLLVITHVDSDHIGGALSCLAEADAVPGLKLHGVWFNGFGHLSGAGGNDEPDLESMGPVQGEQLTRLLRDTSWNAPFHGKPICRRGGEPLPSALFHDGLRLTVLGPTPERLKAFEKTWQEEVQEAVRRGRLEPAAVPPGLESLGPGPAPVLMDDADLETLAANRSNESDAALANGTSIVLLLEYRNRRLLLTGDAFSADLVAAIKTVSPHERLRLDLLKVPHHGSRNNLHRNLVDAVDCDRWLVSTDGTRFKHPDAEAIARIIRFSSRSPPRLVFNVPSAYNRYWNKPAWQSRYNYETEYGSTKEGWSFVFD